MYGASVITVLGLLFKVFEEAKAKRSARTPSSGPVYRVGTPR